MSGRRAFCYLLLFVFGFSAAFRTASATSGADPVINRPYQNPDYGSWTSVFERPGREVYDRREAIVAATGIAPGMVVADIGAGTGLFTRLFASRVSPGGRVIAVDIAEEFIHNIIRTAREQGHDNVQGVVNDQHGTGLDPNSIDLAFICDTYHHFEQPRAMLDSIHRALRPAGELIIIDFQRVPGESSSWVMGHVRGGRDSVIREVEQAGFRLTAAPELLNSNYFLKFVRLP